MSVRVRYAPSPTGKLHVGALRTVLFNYLFAKRHGGVNILRIEDTDRTRYDAASEKAMIETLKWAGIEFDEGPHVGGPFPPYHQSNRKEAGIYEEWIQKLMHDGHAYKAFETPAELDDMREFQQINKQPTGYFGGKWRDASEDEVAAAEASGMPFVIRQRVPRGRSIVVQDAIRGRVEFDSDVLTDLVLIKGDGMPTYHFAATVDDHLMGITHVFRGEEWVPTSPNHVLLYEQFGWAQPVWVHCPVIVGKGGKKLSKRDGATSVLDYGAQGYLKDALKNFVALIGWSPGDEREIMTVQEQIEAFDIKGIQPSPGKFDLDKLKWMNGHAIRALEADALMDVLLEFIADPVTTEYWTEYIDENPEPNKPPVDGNAVLAKLKRIEEAAKIDRAYVLAAIKEEQERVQTLVEFGEACEFFLVDEVEMDPKAVDKWLKQPHTAELLDWILEKTSESKVSTVEHFESIIRGFQTHKSIEKLGPVVHPTRVALTGKTTGPGLFELMSVLGIERIQKRVHRAKALIGS